MCVLTNLSIISLIKTEMCLLPVGPFARSKGQLLDFCKRKSSENLYSAPANLQKFKTELGFKV